jgi:hypothetical protein
MPTYPFLLPKQLCSNIDYEGRNDKQYYENDGSQQFIYHVLESHVFEREKKLFKPPNLCFYMSKVKLALSQMSG